MTKKIKVIVKNPGQKSEIREIEQDYRELQKIVGGLITSAGIFSYPSRIAGYVNDEGLLIGMEPNVRAPYGQMLVGPLVFTGLDSEGGSKGLTLPQVTKIRDFLQEEQSGDSLLRELDLL